MVWGAVRCRAEGLRRRRSIVGWICQLKVKGRGSPAVRWCRCIPLSIAIEGAILLCLAEKSEFKEL